MASETKDPPSDTSLPEQEPPSINATPLETPPYQLPIPHWLFSMTGHVIAAATGLGLGYLLLHWLRPGKFPLPW